ncbi:hypothetical protein TrCOL_g1728 [Triparma columacea]|uniref:Citrate transporter-like domain-containing protein n=1 Tax=Triparma columacea TaxID=722753 RepID=A0A9W7L7B6_9STRA|nr:hypothetical protein TrCOL_g1728 [Triparma columacea]
MIADGAVLLASPFILTSQGLKGWGYFKSAHFSPSKFQVINYMSDAPGDRRRNRIYASKCPLPAPSPSSSKPFYLLGVAVFFVSYYLWLDQNFKQSVTILTIYGAMTAMACFNVASDLAMFTSSVFLLLCTVINRDDFLSGYGNSSVVTVGLLLVVAKGVEETGALEWLVKALLGKPKSRTAAQLIMMLPVLLISAFLSNTACVAI